MNILIVYGTNSGGTWESSQIIQQTLSLEHQVTIQHAKDTHVRDFGKYQFIILGSCTWERFVDEKKLEGQLQEHMHALAFQLRGHHYPNTKFAVFALGDSSYTEYCAAADHLEKLVTDLQAQKVGSTLRLDGYFFDLPTNRKLVEDWAKELAQSL